VSVEFENMLRARFGSRWKKARGRRGIEYRACCPFCPRNRGEQDKLFKLYMNPSLGVYNCYRCSSSGTLSDMFAEFRRTDPQAFAPQQVVRREQVHVDMPGAVVPLHTLERDHVARNYLERRGFNVDILSEAFGLYYCSTGRTYGDGVSFFYNTSNTIIFPVWMHGKLMGWQSRLLFDPDKLTDEQCETYGFPQNDEGEFVRPPKYYTPYGMSKGDVLYNFDNARKSKLVVVAEGPLDVAGIGMCGVGTFGKGISDIQAKLLKEYWDMVIIMLDPGDADAESRQLQMNLQMSVPTVQVTLQGVKDPGDASFERVWTQIYDAAIARGYDITQLDLGPWNKAIIRVTDRL
jgi:hypothetical protein